MFAAKEVAWITAGSTDESVSAEEVDWMFAGNLDESGYVGDAVSGLDDYGAAEEVAGMPAGDDRSKDKFF